MTLLNQIRSHWRDHLSVLQWLEVLYRHPQQLKEQLVRLSRRQVFCVGSIFYLHMLPYIVIIAIIGRFLLFGVLGMELQGQLPSDWSTLILLHGTCLAKGISFGFVGLLIALALIKIIFDAIAAMIAMMIINGAIFGVVQGMVIESFAVFILPFIIGIFFGVSFCIAEEKEGES